MIVYIELPFFPGMDEEESLSLIEYPDIEVWACDVKLQQVQGECGTVSYGDLIFNRHDYEKDLMSAWVEEWKDNAPKDVVKSVDAHINRRNPNHLRADVELKDGWQDVMSAFIQKNGTWLKESCGLSQELENWSKYLFEDQDEDRIADMIGYMMYKEDEDIEFNLVSGVHNRINAPSYVFLTEEGLAKVIEEAADNEQDEEIRVLTAVKKWYRLLTATDSDKQDYGSWIDFDRRDEYLDSIYSLVKDKYRKEWYKNYIGTKKITFDGPTNYEETGEITDEDISDFMSGSWKDFFNYRLKVGHTERQDRFTALMRNYPLEILDWLRGGWNGEVIPYIFYEGVAEGGEYELYGYSKGEFIDILRDTDYDEQEVEFEYAAVLEEEYGIDYAVEYLLGLDYYSLFEYSNGTADFILSLLSKAVEHKDNYHALLLLAYYRLYSPDDYSFNVDVDLSIEMYSRLASMWKKGLISDDWLTDDLDTGLAAVFDFEWGDDYWEEDSYPEHPDEDDCRIWLLKLLESDFAEDIADYLKPLLELVMEKEKNHNWETGKKAIETFLQMTS